MSDDAPAAKRTRSVNAGCPIYPPFAFTVSPTFNKWVKLTCADIAALRRERRFDGHDPAILFHLNHPIRYVYAVGTVVSSESIGDGRWHTLTIDDGSGATVEVKLERLKEKESTRAGSAITTGTDKGNDGNTESGSSQDELENEQRPDGDRRSLPTAKTTATTVSGVSIRSYDVFMGDTMIDIGSVIKVKGMLQIWRSAIQVQLARLSLVSTSDEEVRVWGEYADFVQRVLAKPWHVSSRELGKLQAKERSRADGSDKERARRPEDVRSASDRRRADDLKRRIYQAKLEKRLQKEAALLDGNPLV